MKDKPVPESPYFSTDELATYVKRSAGAIHNLVLRRKIPFHKPAGRLLFDRREIDAWIRMSGVTLDQMKGDG